MFACPICGSTESKVTRTCNREFGVLRYRKCALGHSYSTKEVVVVKAKKQRPKGRAKRVTQQTNRREMQ